jgi:hypothetical protein
LSGVAERFQSAWTGADDVSTTNAELLPVRLARACVEVLAVDGAGLSLMQDDFRVPLGASDETASLAERLQFTQGEGPCLTAALERRSIAVDSDAIERRWPVFARELMTRTPYRALLSLPLALSAGTSGALDLYVVTETNLGAVSLADAATVADGIVHTLRLAEETTGASRWTDEPYPAWLEGPTTGERRLVWVATGMVMTALDMAAADALDVLRGYAYGHDTVLDDVAAALVDGTLSPEQLGT